MPCIKIFVFNMLCIALNSLQMKILSIRKASTRKRERERERERGREREFVLNLYTTTKSLDVLWDEGLNDLSSN